MAKYLLSTRLQMRAFVIARCRGLRKRRDDAAILPPPAPLDKKCSLS